MSKTFDKMNLPKNRKVNAHVEFVFESPWRDLPVHCENILKVPVADTNKYLPVQIDSTFCKVHQHAAVARKIRGNQALGVSRGGKNIKIHALITKNFSNLLGDKAFPSVNIRGFVQKKLIPS